MPSEKPEIKGIIFDCFGVLATDGWLPFKNKYFKEKPALFRKATELKSIGQRRNSKLPNIHGTNC